MQPITSLAFAGKSDCLVSASRGSRAQLSVWSMSKLCVSWSYKLQVEGLMLSIYIFSQVFEFMYPVALPNTCESCADMACAVDLSMFAVLVLLPKPSTKDASDAHTFEERDGVILLFNVTDPVPVATWSVRKVGSSS